MSKAHPGFAKAAEGISKRQHLPLANARAILGAAKAKASPSAKRANPHLRNTPGHIVA